MTSPVQGAWARALGGSSLSPGLVTGSSRSSAAAPSASGSPSAAARSSSLASLGDGFVVVLESVGELQKELSSLRPLVARVEDLEERLAASESANERMADSLAVLTALVTRLCREDAAGQAALARLGEETARLRGALGGGGAREAAAASPQRRTGGHGRVRTLGGGGGP